MDAMQEHARHLTAVDGPRVLVCGGKNYALRERVWEELAKLKPSFVIEGGAGGADAWAKLWAEANLPPDRHLQFKVDPQDLKRYGGYAPHIRNQRMLEEGRPNVVLAFIGGRGTSDMLARARIAETAGKLRIIEIV